MLKLLNFIPLLLLVGCVPLNVLETDAVTIAEELPLQILEDIGEDAAELAPSSYPFYTLAIISGFIPLVILGNYFNHRAKNASNTPVTNAAS